MALQAVVAVPAKVAATAVKVASTVATTAVKAGAQASAHAARGTAQAGATAARSTAQAGATTARSTAQAGSTAMRSTAHAGRGVARAPRPNGILSQASRQADSFRSMDAGKSGEQRMMARAARFAQARSSSKGPKRGDGVLEELMRLASGQQESERGRG